MNYKRDSLRLRALIVGFVLFFSALMLGAPARAQEPQAGPKIDFSVLAVMGDSLSQSYNDGVLHVESQQRNYITLLAKQVGTELRQALIAEPGGYGDVGRLVLIDPSIPIEPLNPFSFRNLTLQPVNMGRIDPSVRVNNFAIGGARVNDIINARPDPANPDTALFASLGIPWLSDNPPVRRSQLEFVEAMNPKPTAVILFIGGNDALSAAGFSDLSRLTPADKFIQDYEEIVRRTKATGAQMILVTVPDVPLTAFVISGKDLPFIFRVEQKLFTQFTGIQPEDFVTLRAFTAILDALSGKGPVPEDLVLRQKMAKTISKTIKKYNAAITKIAKREKFALVDLNALLRQAASPNGVEIPGVARLSNKYFGGIASLDGVHLTNTGNALLANTFIQTINKFYGTNFPLVDVVPIAKADPEIPKPTSVTQPAAMPTIEEWLEAIPQLEAVSRALTKIFAGEMQQ